MSDALDVANIPTVSVKETALIRQLDPPWHSLR
jgi:hypothetical protein